MSFSRIKPIEIRQLHKKQKDSATAMRTFILNTYIYIPQKYSFIRKEFRKNVRKTFSEIRKGIYEYQLKVALKLARFDFCWLIVLMLAK